MKLIRYMAGRPFLASLVVLLLVAIPGYWRVDTIARDGRDTAADMATLLERFEAKSARDELERCQVRNSAQRSTRDTFHALLDRLVELGSNPAAVDQLRTAVAPADEVDHDCNDDGVLDDEDYG